MSTLQEEVPTNTSEDFGFKSLGQKNILPSSEESLPFASLEHFSILNGKSLYIAYSNDRLIIGDLQILRDFVQNKEELSRDELDKLFEETIPDVIFCGFNANGKAILVTKSGAIITIDTNSFEKSQESIELNKTIITAKLFHNLLWILDDQNTLFYFDPINHKTSETIKDNVSSFDLYDDKLYLLLNTETENIQIFKGERSPKLEKSFSNPDEINETINDDSMEPTSISVVSEKKLLIVYGNNVSPDDEDISYDQKMYIAELNDDETSLTFHESFDIDPPFGSVLRYPYFYNILFKNLIPDCDFISVLGSSCASELTIYDSKEVVQPSQDSERAVLPISQITDNDTNPTGLALDISTSGKIFDVCLGVDEIERLPLIYILNNEGDLQIVGLFHSTAIKEGKFNLSSLEDDLHKNNRIVPLTTEDTFAVNVNNEQPAQVDESIKNEHKDDSQSKPTFGKPFGSTTENPFTSQADTSNLVSPFASLSTKSNSDEKTASEASSAFTANKPFSFGQASTPQSSLGQTSLGQTSFGHTSFGQTSFGQKPFSEKQDTTSSAFGKPAFGNLTLGPTAENSTEEQKEQENSVSSFDLNATSENKPEQNQNTFGNTSFGAPSFGAPSFGTSTLNTGVKPTESAFGKPSFGTPSFGQSTKPAPSFGATGSVFGSIGNQESPFANIGKQESPFTTVGKQESPFANIGKQESPFANIGKQQSPFAKIGKQQSPFANIGKQESPFTNIGKQESPFGDFKKALPDLDKEENGEQTKNEESSDTETNQDHADSEKKKIINEDGVDEKKESTIESLTNKIKKSANISAGSLEFPSFTKPPLENAALSPSPFSSFANKIKEPSNAFTSFSMENNPAITLRDSSPVSEDVSETSEGDIVDEKGTDDEELEQDLSQDVIKNEVVPEIRESEPEMEKSSEELELDATESENEPESDLAEQKDDQTINHEILPEDADLEVIKKTKSIENVLKSNDSIPSSTLQYGDSPRSIEELTGSPEAAGEFPLGNDLNESDEKVESFEDLSGVATSDGEGVNGENEEAKSEMVSNGIQAISETNSIDIQTEIPEVDDKCIPLTTSIDVEVQTKEYRTCNFEMQAFEGGESYLAELHKPAPLKDYYTYADIKSMPPLSKDPIMSSMEKTYYLIEAELGVLTDNITNLDKFFIDQNTLELEKRTVETLPNLYTWRISETQRLCDLIDGLKDGYLSNGNKLEELSESISESTVQVLKTKNEMDELKEFIFQVEYMADTAQNNKYCRLGLHQTKMQSKLRQKMSRTYDELQSITESLNILKVYISKDSVVERDMLIEKMDETKKHHQGVLATIKKLQEDIERLNMNSRVEKTDDLDKYEDFAKEDITSIDIVGLGIEQNTKKQLGSFFKRLNKEVI
ncbi:similar to Saccharomyces cerevisiae YIL115C NUP159 Nucleoporin, subunit of the Nup82 subcomplex of the nuclear pore [Maudiozyma saulgeensis]|uniref:Similar to Saccharomyces cerevisiae YIL115C NUP159 Nucleoporin, subunit of the Nup82 subcomplex of the nuclear pore n=1 Tax=Maudiozyma saulgeensis TaxID=1789683 RepID=A0A1X7R4H7_9SACH|nr:similar to Saccharomyces cerevisiae YIL115C NUP159 Nucleoporin, subunit of the Nup82 subcomplex of the nuclear pore [Kazachstania saulgeensis]